MKLRIIYRERGIEHRVVVGDETKVMILAKFERSFPGAKIVRVEEIGPPPASAKRAIAARQDHRPQTTDEQRARYAAEAHRLADALRAKISPTPPPRRK